MAAYLRITAPCSALDRPHTSGVELYSLASGTVLRLVRDDDREFYRAAYHGSVVFVPKSAAVVADDADLIEEPDPGLARSTQAYTSIEPHGRELKYCFSCGEQTVPGARYCARCGTEFAPHTGGISAGVVAGVRFGTFWQRAGAFILDFLAVLGLAVIPGGALGALVGWFAYEAQGPFVTQLQEDIAIENAAIVGFYIFLAVYTITSAVYWSIGTGAGRTWGKRALGLRVVRVEDGSKPRGGRGFLRWLTAWMASSSIFYLGFLWMLWDDKRQTWHDKISGTLVVRDEP